MGFQQGLSGLNASSKALDSVGNNIANSNTVGFKSAATQFSDVFAATLGGGSQVGIGTSVSTISQSFGQGNITVTSNPLDLAINGQGFFRLNDNGSTTWTRNGQFNVDKDGYIVNATGFKLTGYLADANNVIVPSTPADIFINTADLQPQATGGTGTTGGVKMGFNLDSRSPNLGNTTFNFNDPTTYTSSTSVTVYDTLGNPHLMSIYFCKGDGTASIQQAAANPIGTTAAAAAAVVGTLDVATNAAAANIGAAASAAASLSNATPASIQAAILAAVTTAGGASIAADAAAIWTAVSAVVPAPPANVWRMYTSLDSGTTIGTDATGPTAVTFNSTGALTAPAGGITAITYTLTNGAANLTYNYDVSGSTQYGNIFGVNSISQDGYTSGRLAGLAVAADGVIQGRYSNGQTRDLAQVVLGNFANPNGLGSLGNNQWTETPDSGQPLIGVPGSGSLGIMQSAAVEESNVDLTAELVQMITQQRVYQANAQTIKTQDQVLQTLVNLR